MRLDLCSQLGAFLLASFVASGCAASSQATRASKPQPPTSEAAAAPANDAKPQPPMQPSTSAASTDAADAAKPQPKSPGMAAVIQAPIFDETFWPVPVARVEGDAITLKELMDAVAGTHEGREATSAAASDFKPVLDRLIDLRLLLLEARAAGLDETPKYKEAIKDFEAVTLRTMLQDELTKDVQPDPKEVEGIFKATVREWKVRSLLFEKDEGAKELVAAVKAGKKFEDLAAKLVAEKKAKGNEDAGFAAESKFVPAARAALASLSVGAITEPIKLKEGYTVIRLEEVRYPENAKARAEAEALSLTRQQGEAVRTAYAELTKKHVTKFDKALVAKLDLQVSPARYKALTKDKRVLVAIKGEAPITVGDLANEIAGEFFHGLDQAIKEKRINPKKRQVLDTIAFKRIFDKEARLRKIDESFLFERTVADYANSLLFGAFLDKAIVPGVMVKDEEVQAYYEEKKPEYSTSAFYTLDSIGFPSTAKAQAALDRLQAGTDFKWLKLNAPDQLTDEESDQDLEGRTIMATSMPEALKKVVANAKAGDYRLYVSPSGAAYALQIVGYVPAQARPLDDVREAITKKIFGQNIGKAVKEFAAKLRESYEVELFITRIGR